MWPNQGSRFWLPVSSAGFERAVKTLPSAFRMVLLARWSLSPRTRPFHRSTRAFLNRKDHDTVRCESLHSVSEPSFHPASSILLRCSGVAQIGRILHMFLRRRVCKPSMRFSSLGSSAKFSSPYVKPVPSVASVICAMT